MDALSLPHSLSLFCIALVACAVGAVGVAALRWGGGSAWGRTGFLVFFACLAAQGALAMLAMVGNNNAWMVFGAVLTAMAVGGTLDMSPMAG